MEDGDNFKGVPDQEQGLFIYINLNNFNGALTISILSAFCACVCGWAGRGWRGEAVNS